MVVHLVHAQDLSWKKTAFGTTVQYHSDGKLMENWNVDDSGKRFNNDRGYSIIKFEYDKQGNIKKQSYLDAERNPALDNLGVSIWKYKYDKNNNKIYQGHFGIDGTLMPTNDNIVYSEWHWKYTKENELKKTRTKNKL